MHLSCACMASDTQQVMQVLTCMSHGSEIIWAAWASMRAYDGMMQPDDPIRVLLANFIYIQRVPCCRDGECHPIFGLDCAGL